jgi:hypothetical protein
MKSLLKIFIVALATFVVLTDTHWANGSCTFNSLPFLSNTFCFAPTTSSGFSYTFVYRPNPESSFYTPWSFATNQVTSVIRTSTGYLMVHNNRVWFAYSGVLLWSDGIWQVWATGATGPSGNTWATGPQWNDGYSAFELAQINWYTGNILSWLSSLVGPMWPQGNTWTIDFSTFTGAIQFANVVNIPAETGATLDPNWFYFALTRKVDGVTYMDWVGVRNFLFVFSFLLVVVLVLRYFVNDKKSIWR